MTFKHNISLLFLQSDKFLGDGRQYSIIQATHVWLLLLEKLWSWLGR